MQEPIDPYPLGEPKGRKPDSNGLTKIPGRPHWFTDRKGKEIYVDPHAPPKTGEDAVERKPV